jgi:glycosyltransferase involved in cell wall biosynthesis
VYVPDGYPSVSESFVINEIWLLERLGHRIAVEPMRAGAGDAGVHERLVEMAPRVPVGRPGGRIDVRALPAALLRASQYWPGRRPAALARQARNALAVAELARRIRAHRPDAIVTHFAFDNAVAGAIAARRLGVPMVLWMHGTDFYGHPHRHLRWITDACASVVVATPYGERELRELGVRCPIAVSRLGVDVERFAPDGPETRELAPTLLCVARLGHNKNHERLLRVFARVRRELPDAVLWLAGAGPRQAAIEAAIDELGLKDAVRFLGAVGDLQTWMRRAWLKVLFSDKEGLGVVLMEAAACGLPAVASRVGGVPEVIVDGETGLLVDWSVRDAEADAAARLVALLGDAEWRAELGRTARERALALFDERGHAARLDALLQRVTA